LRGELCFSNFTDLTDFDLLLRFSPFTLFFFGVLLRSIFLGVLLRSLFLGVPLRSIFLGVLLRTIFLGVLLRSLFLGVPSLDLERFFFDLALKLLVDLLLLLDLVLRALIDIF